MADVERPGRICRDELDLNGFLFLRFGAPVVLPCSSTCRITSSLASGLTRILRKPAPATVSGSNRPVAANAGALALAISSAICRGLRRRRLESWSAMLLA